MIQPRDRAESEFPVLVLIARLCVEMTLHQRVDFAAKTLFQPPENVFFFLHVNLIGIRHITVTEGCGKIPVGAVRVGNQTVIISRFKIIMRGGYLITCVGIGFLYIAGDLILAIERGYRIAAKGVVKKQHDGNQQNGCDSSQNFNGFFHFDFPLF